MLKIRTTAVLALLLSALLAGCAGPRASGEKLSFLEPPPADKAAVYFYRQARFNGGGAKVMLVDNHVSLGRLENGQYTRHLLDPGLHRLHSDTMHIDRPLEMVLEAGQSYFVHVYIDAGMWVVSWRLEQTSEAEAVPAMKACCRSGE